MTTTCVWKWWIAPRLERATRQPQGPENNYERPTEIRQHSGGSTVASWRRDRAEFLEAIRPILSGFASGTKRKSKKTSFHKHSAFTPLKMLQKTRCKHCEVSDNLPPRSRQETKTALTATNAKQPTRTKHESRAESGPEHHHERI